MARLAELSVLELFKKSSSTEPIPGGGGVTALCGVLGIGLILKALRISARREAHVSPERRAGEFKLEDFATRLVKAADADGEAFNAYIAAFKLPRGTDGEKAIRARAIEDAAVTASNAALITVEIGRDATSTARKLQVFVSPNIMADFSAGIQLLRVMNSVALENVDTNLGSVKDGDTRASLEAKLKKYSERQKSL